MRLACQLRPSGDVSVVPLVRTALPVYRPPARQRNTERDIVVMFCDFLNRDELAHQQLPQDLLYLLTLYGEALSEAIRAEGGTLGVVGVDGICALFGLDHQAARAALLALQAAERNRARDPRLRQSARARGQSPIEDRGEHSCRPRGGG